MNADRMNPRTFLIGIVTGIAMVIGSFVAVCEIAQIKWQPVSVRIAQ